MTDPTDLLRRIEALEAKGPPIVSLDTQIVGMFQTVSVAPTAVPHSLYDQIKIYVNSTTYRLYWYDTVGHTWHYILATA